MITNTLTVTGHVGLAGGSALSVRPRSKSSVATTVRQTRTALSISVTD